ncbi:MAG: C10 family peptidase [Paludibacteraceae bacterium]|nr:C10 family peptidase [Paludibacteraceae bacterium]
MKNMLWLIGLLCVAEMTFATERSVEEAQALALQFANAQAAMSPARGSERVSKTIRLAHTRNKLNNNTPAFYVFNNEDNQGYVVVSADSRTEDIPLYAEEGQFDADNINPNLRFWLNHLQEEISQANDSNAVDKVTPRKLTTAIPPLLVNEQGKEITWYQEAPYYNLCPIDKYDNTRCLTGCVATAAAQVMYKWRYPKQGTGSKTYTWINANYRSQRETLTANFGSTAYDWDNMLPSYEGVYATTAQKNAVATLMYQLGVASEMEYGGDAAGGSGAYTDQLADGLVNYFGYKVSKFVTTASRYDYGTSAFSPAEFSIKLSTLETYFNEDLEAGRPIVMGGEDEDGGHEFVCDGRNANGYFHINWGWEGDGNCYCLLSALKPLGYSYTFSNSIDAIIGLQPQKIDSVHVSSLTVSPQSATLKINEKLTLTATVSPADATDKYVTWSSSNTNVALVTDGGIVRAVGQGSATITATSRDGNKKSTAQITVTDEFVMPDVFTLVTDVAQLMDGDQIILVGTVSNVHYAATKNLTAGKSNAYLGCEQVAITDKTITLDEASNVAIFTVGLDNNMWTLINQNNQSLSASAVKKLSWSGLAKKWTISIVGNGATVTNSVSSYGRILLNENNGSPRFCNYGSTTTTSRSLVLPQVYARSLSKPIEVVHVIGVTMGQNTARMVVGQEIPLFCNVSPANATNQNVAWSSSNTSIATVSKTGEVTAWKPGTVTITVTTNDGSYKAVCVITVYENELPKVDTVYVTASEAMAIAQSLEPGEMSDIFYGVKGYVTSPNSSSYLGFYIDDNPGNMQTFQGYNCQMPSGVAVLQEGLYVCIYGYITNYDDRKWQIKDGEVALLDVPTDLNALQIPDMDDGKFIYEGHLYLLYRGHVYNSLGW